MTAMDATPTSTPAVTAYAAEALARPFAGQRVLVLGLGDSGLAMARWCAARGAGVRVWDSREAPPRLEALREQLPAAEFHSGAPGPDLLDGVQRVLRSPGLSPLDARLQPLLQEAGARGLTLQGELGLFAEALAVLKAERRYEPAVLAITGTNGKTTTTSMTALLAERAGKRVAVAGNIGPTMLDTLAAALALEPEPASAEAPAQEPDADATATPAEVADAVAAEDAAEAADSAHEADPQDAGAIAAADAETEDEDEDETAPDAAAAAAAPDAAHTSLAEIDALLDEAPLPIKPPPPRPACFEHLPEVWVLELSSFQLEGVEGFEPTAAAVLNITQDHLDWHGDMAAYAAAKARIFGPTLGSSTLMVINRDDPAVEAMVPAPLQVKQGRGRPARTVARAVCRFGLNPPRAPGDYGLVHEGGMAWLVRARELDDTPRRGRRGAAEEDEPLLLQRLMPADALRVRGRHNAANALAALALASAAGCALAPMLHGLREYRGEPHRVEHVGTLDGVDFVDDSKGTNVGATVAAILGLGLDRAPAKLLLILGGDGKGQDFSPLREPLERHARAIALIGRDAEAIAASLAGCGLPLQRHDSLEAATRWCAEQAQTGDSVLLSPACASLDMFRNYAHRAEVFVATVRLIAQDRGLEL